jgi:hypothetical protein
LRQFTALTTNSTKHSNVQITYQLVADNETSGLKLSPISKSDVAENEFLEVLPLGHDQ